MHRGPIIRKCCVIFSPRVDRAIALVNFERRANFSSSDVVFGGSRSNSMAEGMEVDPAPAVRDKKRFEVKKVSAN